MRTRFVWDLAKAESNHRKHGIRFEDAVRVFILPPSLEELRRRLVTRSQDAEDVIERRVANAKGEIDRATTAGGAS